MSTSYADQPLGSFLNAIAAKEPAPGGGAVAATALAMAAGLVAMAARFSGGQLANADERAAHADRLRERAAPLAERDAQAYGQVVAAYRLPREPDPEERRERIRTALRGAAEVPAEIARTAAEVAEAGVRLMREGNPNLTGDAFTAVMLADASARAAARLVAVNVESGNLGAELTEHARRCVDRTTDCASQVGAGGRE